ncbi:MAG: hypothetical protein KY455_03050 [Euryarchaeota archaeon]|nr:hypothetical protein [Euryarchaeota archaeon]
MVPSPHGRHHTSLSVLVIAVTALAGCITGPEVSSATSCGTGEPGPGDLQVQVASDHEHSDWDAATDKHATITPMVDNGSAMRIEDKERLPALTGPLDENDCIVFQDIEPGWWEVRATARADMSGCSWYGGSGKMVFVDPDQAVSSRFEPTLACS